MSEKLLPTDIFKFLSSKVLGQDDVLKKVAVAIYKHINGLKAGNLLMIGSSGTGKTTVMNAIQKFYEQHNSLKRFRTMTIMNANMLCGEDPSEVNTGRLMMNLELAVNNTFGAYTTDEKLKEYMENATVCLDEIDKISSHIAGKVNVAGIAVQQALLTLLEGERVLYETTRQDAMQKRKVRIPVETDKMLFICGGAFEGIHDQIYEDILEGRDDRELVEMEFADIDGKRIREKRLILKDQIRLLDLFKYGMVPQFISRFHGIAVLEELGISELKKIMLTADDSPLRHSREYFKSMDIELQITKDALELIASHAVVNTRIGARALREVFTKIITVHEYDPYGSDKLEKNGGKLSMTIDKEMIMEHF